MDVLFPAREVSLSLSRYAACAVPCPLDGHRSAIRFKEAEDPLAQNLYRKHAVGNDPELFFSRNRYPPAKWVALAESGLGERDFVLNQQSHVILFATRDFQCDHNVGNH